MGRNLLKKHKMRREKESDGMKKNKIMRPLLGSERETAVERTCIPHGHKEGRN